MNIGFRGLAAVVSLLAGGFAAEAVASELVVEDREHLERLAARMDAELAAIRSVRATLRSRTFLESPGSRQLRMETGPTRWLSRGAQYRYETQERTFEIPDLAPAASFKAGGVDADAAGAEVVPVTEEPAALRVRRLVRAMSDQAVIEFDPDRPGEVQIGDADQLHAALNIERFRHDPRHAGLTVLGATLSDLLAGGSWRLRPEDVSDDVRRTVAWRGVQELSGRPHEVVEVTVAWEAQGHRARRSYTIWIDPERNHTVPLMVGYYDLDGEQVEFERLTVELLRDEQGRWLPRRAEHRLRVGSPGAAGSMVTVTEVDAIAVNEHVDAAELQVTIPPGAWVYDHTLKYRFRYTLGTDEQVVEEIAQTLADRTRSARAGAAAGRVPIAMDRTDGVSPTAWGWSLLAGAAVVSGLAGFTFFATRGGERKVMS